MAELNSELRLKQTQSKPATIRKYCGGTCTYCGEIPTKKLKYDIGDGDKLVEFYCNKCFERWIKITLKTTTSSYYLGGIGSE